MVAVLPIAPMMRIAKPGNQRCDRKGVFFCREPEVAEPGCE